MKQKVFWLLPLMMVLLMVGVNAVYWNCPQAGTSSTNTVVKNYMTYEDDPPYINCQKSGNNFTIEFTLDTSDFVSTEEGDGTYANATLYIMQGSSNKFILPLSANFTNGTEIKWTDFGELYTSGMVGKPKWYNNLTEGGYKWYIRLDNNTDSESSDQLLSTTRGFDSSNPVYFIIDHRGSTAMKTAAAYQAGADVGPGAASVFSGIGLPSVVGKIPTPIFIALIIGAVWYFFFRKE